MGSDSFVSDDKIIEAMQKFGGSFVKALAEAWLRADMPNKYKLKAAFPEYWQDYAAIARRS